MDVKKVYDELVEIKLSLVKIEDDLKYHIKRTDILEDSIKPVISTFTVFKWVVISIGSMLGAAASIVKIIELFK
jgi:hypothetical protein